MRNTYRVLEVPRHASKLKVGDVLYDCYEATYGCKSDDERVFGVPCLSLTEKENGGGPFIIVKCSDVERVDS